MDERIEIPQWKIDVVEWALIGMIETDHKPEKKDLNSLRVLVAEVNRVLDDAIEEASKLNFLVESKA